MSNFTRSVMWTVIGLLLFAVLWLLHPSGWFVFSAVVWVLMQFAFGRTLLWLVLAGLLGGAAFGVFRGGSRRRW